MVPGALLGAGSGPVPRLPGRAGEGRDQRRPIRGRGADPGLLARDHLPAAHEPPHQGPRRPHPVPEPRRRGRRQLRDLGVRPALQPLLAPVEGLGRSDPPGHRSGDIAWTALHDVLAEELYSHLTVVTQVLLKNLFPDTADLTDRQRRYVQRRASVDFVLYNRVTNEPVLAVEVDGFAFHENEPAQRERDETEDQIFRTRRLPLLRLPTTGSGEPDRIRAALDAAEPG
ncbi:DUF2726 domain-containing protein [Saccharopolyspora endophytica]|uniref:DUF2726 domain-containing protein n=1 Tax=Saccharopolyspora endophytica TaxID=543886 RepID=A0ABS5DNZ4_9PSEU|nr:DUF2726 domain-containing protein [Saccharopolyspora endophytica]